MEKENIPAAVKMLQTKKHKHVDIPLQVNGNTRYIKGVTKHTTCGDVIKMVLRKSPPNGNGQMDSYAIFESSRGIERILPGKSRLVKVMRSWGTDSNFEFAFRKVNPIMSVPKISEAKRRRLTQRLHTATGSENNASDTHTDKYADAAKLAGLVQSQKTKLHRYESLRNTEFVKELYFKDSDDSMDEFISCVDQRNMEGFLNFCGSVTSNKINKLSTSSSSNLERNITGQSERPSMVHSHNVSMTKINNVKYAVRKTLKSKTVSISTDSISNDETRSTCRPVKHKFIDCSPSREPFHSTPCNKVPRMETRLARRHEQLASDITNKVARMNQREGKDALLQKYFADYLTYNSPGCSTSSSTSRRTRGDGAESGYQSPHCRRGDGAEDAIYTKNTRSSRTQIPETVVEEDADSGQEDETEVSNFDIAFIDEQVNIPDCEPKCVGKLVDYSLSDIETSFDSDASEPSIISKASDVSSDVSSVSDIVKNIFSDSTSEDEDDLMESFMKTKHVEDFMSDEGLGSIGSDDEKEIIV